MFKSAANWRIEKGRVVARGRRIGVVMLKLLSIFAEFFRIEAARVDSDAQRAVVFLCDVDEILDFFIP